MSRPLPDAGADGGAAGGRALSCPPPRSAAGEEARHIVLQGTTRQVPYLLRRGVRRTIGLTIDQRGLRVGAPRGVALADIERFIQHHASWVASKLDEWAARQPPPRLVVADGVVLPVLGEDYTLRLSAGANRFLWEPAAARLHLQPRPASDPAALLLRALRTRALGCFTERMFFHADRLGVALPRLGLSNAATRWGSCSSRSGIRLNWRLVHMPLPIVDYVVVHELCHLLEMNHSPRFWSLVESMLPDYSARRAALRQMAGRLPHL